MCAIKHQSLKFCSLKVRHFVLLDCEKNPEDNNDGNIEKENYDNGCPNFQMFS
jgi:hypothetical protein